MSPAVRALLAIALGAAWMVGLFAFVAQRGADPRTQWERARDVVHSSAAPLFPQAKEVRVFAGRPIRLANSARPIDGGPLSAPEIALLRRSVFYAPPPHTISLCCLPHHTFVFYGRDGKQLGLLEVCFQCLCASVWPSGVAGAPKRSVDWDADALRTIVLAHHLPSTDQGFPRSGQ